MILVVDVDLAQAEPLAQHLSQEGLTASASAGPPPPEPEVPVAVSVVVVRHPGALGWLRGWPAGRTLALVPDALRVPAFERGADDVLQLEPLSRRELTLRVRNLLRRPAPEVRAAPPPTPPWLHGDDQTVSIGDRRVPLSPTEFALLSFLAENPGHAVSRARLLHRVWGGECDARTVDSTVKRLRARLRGVLTIETVRGLGYRLSPPA